MASVLEALHEDEVTRNPYNLKLWVSYLTHLKDADADVRFKVFERALKHLPVSYKLWKAYLAEWRKQLENAAPDDPSFAIVNDLHKTSLVHLSRMPMLWLDYTAFLNEQGQVTRTRLAYDAALMSLPITQHNLIWEQYIPFIKDCDLPVQAKRVWRRYLMLYPQFVEAYVAYLVAAGNIGEAVLQLANVVNDDSFESIEGKTRLQLWLELCDLISTYPQRVKGINVESVLRAGIHRYSDAVGALWVCVANYSSRMGYWSRARDVFEEALASVHTVRDVTVIFDAYVAFEEGLVNELLQQDRSKESLVDLHLYRLEDLLNRRQDILSQVKLRQNPHSCYEWMKRVKLFEKDPLKVASVYAEALKTVDPERAVGRPSRLWIRYALFYEENGSLEDSREVMRNAVEAPYRNLDDLASVWCARVELELRHGHWDAALAVARDAVRKPKLNEFEEGSLRYRLRRSVKLWSLLVDMEESFGTAETMSIAYDTMFDIQVITPLQLINYTLVLEGRHAWEESFRVFERAVSVFEWPQLKDIWLAYLSKFIKRFQDSKVERTRELFAQCLAVTPPKFMLLFVVYYSQFEEKAGLARHAISVLANGLEKVPDEERPMLYRLLIAKTTQYYGIAKTRPIYEQALETLPVKFVTETALEFSAIETGLGEVARARAVLVYASQFNSPQSDSDFWNQWREFEVANGDEETFKDMLRCKRQIQALFVQKDPTTVAMDAAKKISA
ncbi:MAG: uncharacterized protein KVP18_001413 [Porospora cf. gigantea A]|uniref:uncharacterized protein n=1 Tax=Porospora cf. gigantea A TaxID=2853593 RepID=UPI003559F50A|nr:MAG: hypothetical protein KVP18_001413 [Porospora cf. gigantea A]